MYGANASTDLVCTRYHDNIAYDKHFSHVALMDIDRNINYLHKQKFSYKNINIALISVD